LRKTEIVKKYLFLLFIAGVACQKISDNKQNSIATNLSNPSYASRFTVRNHENDIILILDQPWQGSKSSIKYYLYKDSLPNKVGLEDHVFIKVPIQSMASTSTTHLGLLEVLKADDLLTGFAQTRFIYTQKINNQVSSGAVIEIGNESGLNVESILALQPDILMAFNSGSENKQLKTLQELGVTVVMNADYLEASVLGRAEWIKFIGYFVGKTNEANRYFLDLVIRYDSLKSQVSNAANRPTVLSGTMYGSTWFLPGGKNYNAQLLDDAGSQYLWKSDSSSGWLNLDFEAVYERGWDADIWIGVADFKNLEELKNSDSRYADFRAFQAGQVYTYTNRVNGRGGSDYFESGNIHPDKLLADHIKMLHPKLLPDYQLYYYKRLE